MFDMCVTMRAVAERTQIAALAGKTRQIAAVDREADYRFTTIGQSNDGECMEQEKCTTILLPWMLLSLMYQRVRNFYCTSFCGRKSTQLRWMPTVAAVRACKAASGSVAGAYSTRAPQAERGGVVGQGGRGKEKLNERIIRRLVFW